MRFIFVFFSVLRTLGAKLGSDHFYHVGLITDIRGNRHKFVNSHPNIIGEKYFAYPQLYHWMLSFLSCLIIEKYYKLFGIAISLLQLILFLIFAYTIYPFIQTDISLELYILLSGLIFILTPFSYAIWNAKSTGISARGFGLFLGQIYLYLILWYYFFDNIIYFLAAFLMGFIIIISSQFAMQFVLFSAPLFALFFKNPFFLLIPVFALFLFYLILPEIARNFVNGQINHKTIYYKYLAERLILRSRYSIWRDFVWDFWVKIRKDFKRSILYIYYNPLVSVIIGFPFFTLFVLYFVLDRRVQESVLYDKNVLYLVIPVVVSFLIFFFTSFRKTRFLGEPERYMEFCVPQISVLGVVVFYYSNSIGYMVIVVSLLLIAIQILFQFGKNRFGRTNTSELLENFRKVMHSVDQDGHGTNKIFSNNIEIIKYFLGGNWRILKPNITSLYTGIFHFEDIFPKTYPQVTPDVILPLIEEFEIDWFILDLNMLPKYDDILENNKIILEKRGIVDNYKIFKVCSKT